LFPWLGFVDKDVCGSLDISDVSNACKSLDDDEKLMRTLYVSGQSCEVLTVNEPGLYGLIFKSRKPEAKAFKRWVKHDVLPQIRKTGSFNSNPNMIQIDITKNQPEVLQHMATLSRQNQEKAVDLKS